MITIEMLGEVRRKCHNRYVLSRYNSKVPDDEMSRALSVFCADLIDEMKDAEPNEPERMPSYEELHTLVSKIASFIADGDEIDGEEHEMSTEDAFDTAEMAIDMCRDVLRTDGSDLKPEVAPRSIYDRLFKGAAEPEPAAASCPDKTTED